MENKQTRAGNSENGNSSQGHNKHKRSSRSRLPIHESFVWGFVDENDNEDDFDGIPSYGKFSQKDKKSGRLSAPEEVAGLEKGQQQVGDSTPKRTGRGPDKKKTPVQETTKQSRVGSANQQKDSEKASLNHQPSQHGMKEEDKVLPNPKTATPVSGRKKGHSAPSPLIPNKEFLFVVEPVNEEDDLALPSYGRTALKTSFADSDRATTTDRSAPATSSKRSSEKERKPAKKSQPVQKTTTVPAQLSESIVEEQPEKRVSAKSKQQPAAFTSVPPLPPRSRLRWDPNLREYVAIESVSETETTVKSQKKPDVVVSQRDSSNKRGSGEIGRKPVVPSPIESTSSNPKERGTRPDRAEKAEFGSTKERGTRPDRTEKAEFGSTKERGTRPDRAEKTESESPKERGTRPDRAEKAEFGSTKERGTRPDRAEKAEFGSTKERGTRPDRAEKTEFGSTKERGTRPDRAEKTEFGSTKERGTRPDRAEKVEFGSTKERGTRPDRAEKTEFGSTKERGTRPERAEKTEFGSTKERGTRPERAEKTESESPKERGTRPDQGVGLQKHQPNQRRPVLSSAPFPSNRPDPADVENTATSSFQQLPLSETMLESLKVARYVEPTPIQKGVIPLEMKGVDVMGQAQTGTGKTAAFLIPILEGIEECEPGESPVALILVPTRELAVQVRDEAAKLAYGRDIRVCACYGGKPIAKQLIRLREGVDVIVGTPGRLLDLMNRRALSCEQLRWVVLDEADRMLDIGFRPDIEKILGKTPETRQTLLFSATLPQPVVRLARKYMKNPEVLDFSNAGIAVETIEQYYITVDHMRKFDALVQLVKQEEPKQAIIFCRTKRRAERVGRMLENFFDSIATLHGDVAQNGRDKIMRQFREGSLRYLVATDVVGRGIDVSGISHIINYDIPSFCDDYVHRVGRTGRMGREGVAYTFVTAEEGSELTRIEMRIDRLLKRADLKNFEAFAKPTDSSVTDPFEPAPAKPVFGKPVRKVRKAL
ncbi:MAG: DEAD/DEAH box helicase [Thermoguttaceae bacterium]